MLKLRFSDTISIPIENLVNRLKDNSENDIETNKVIEIIANSLKKLEEINNEIEMIRNSTDNELQTLEDSINLQLNNNEFLNQ